MSEPVIVENPIYWRNVIFRVCLYVVATLIGTALFLAEGRGITVAEIAIIVLMFIAMFYIFVGHSEIVGRPKRIEIVDSGVLLHRRLFPGKKLVHWEDILSVTVFLGEESEIAPEHYWEAYLWLKNKNYYNINRQSALAIREAHLAKFGSYPMRGRPGKIVP